MREICLSNKTYKLEQDPYIYQLQDVAEPELFREIYPYTETPKIPFNYRRVPENMPKDIYLTDTSFRDGQQSRAPYIGIVSDCIEAGLRPRCHFEDITRADFYGFVVPFAYKLMELSRESGIPVKIRACDTMGYGVPYPGAALPRSVSGIIYGLQHHADVPSEQLEWHGHNDFYKGVVNAATAWMYGASAVNCSLLGIGERTGNIPLEAMVFEYASLRGTLNGMDTRAITEIAEYLEKETGYEIPPMTPFVGRCFNLTRAGIHADGMMKDPEIYNIFDTETILGRAPKVAISATSGVAGVAYRVNEYRATIGEEPLPKTSPVIRQIYDWVCSEYDNGRITVITDEELMSHYHACAD